MSHFSCPICGEELHTVEKCLSCENSHSFDVAKSGYVNLLLSQQQKVKRHGDDKLMVRSRRDFLDKGYYMLLLAELLKTVKKYAENGSRILDAGCGECWYTANIYDDLIHENIVPIMLAVDISKDALAIGAKRNPNLELAVASVFHLPVRDASCDLLLSLFAPFSSAEFSRVLKVGGVVIRVIPLEKHLLGLKKAVYEQVYENKAESIEFEGFELLDKQQIRQTIHLKCAEDIQNVFTMTPYYYKTGAKDQEKLKLLTEMDTEIEFGIYTYRKI
jgi:23S rRNA (guanine745-N1)-methyltransferase